MSECFSDNDLPASFQDADCASLSAQSAYLRIFQAILVATVLASFFAWVTAETPRHHKLFGSFALVLGTAALVTTFVMKERKFEDVWYLGRAVAESIKTRSWCYMMAAEPYASDRSQAEVDELFIKDIAAILHEVPNIVFPPVPDKTRSEITEDMRSLRAAPLAVKMKTYLKCRIVDQRDWYGSRSRINSVREAQLFWVVLACQLASVLISFYSLVSDHSLSGSASVFATLSTCFVAWLQVKKYQETAQAYSVASRELGMIATLAECISDPQHAAKYVEESEAAVSREHTLWIARRTSRTQPLHEKGLPHSVA